jgi:hypothetical protein
MVVVVVVVGGGVGGGWGGGGGVPFTLVVLPACASDSTGCIFTG